MINWFKEFNEENKRKIMERKIDDKRRAFHLDIVGSVMYIMCENTAIKVIDGNTKVGDAMKELEEYRKIAEDYVKAI